MLICGLIEFVLCLMYEPIVIDSMVYAVDVDKGEVQILRLKEHVSDYAFDDFIYILTHRSLYKIDYQDLSLVDRTPLPQTFHSFSINETNIMLITTNEIVIIDRENFAFKNGIGIEYGDYRPIVSIEGSNSSGMKNFIYLIADADKNSVIKMFDLNEGRLIKKTFTDKVISFYYDTKDNTLTTMGSNKLTIYDSNLIKKKVVHLPIASLFFRKREDGYIIYNRKGVFFIDKEGNMVDFQPMANHGDMYGSEFLFLADGGLVHLDTLTLRVKHFFQDTVGMRRLFHIDPFNNYAVAIDYDDRFHLIEIESLSIEPMRVEKKTLKEHMCLGLQTDSLWYFQIGAFTFYDNAITLYQQISQRGIPVFIDSTDLYRVKFGGFYDKTLALKLIEKIGFHGWFIIQEKIERNDHTSFFVGFEKFILEDGIIRKE